MLGAVVGTAIALAGCGATFSACFAIAVSWTGDFVIENQSGQTVFVTPMREYQDGSPPPRTLPLSSDFWDRIPAHDLGGFELRDGQSRRFASQCEDVIFTTVAVRSAANEWREVPTTPLVQRSICHAGEIKIVIASWDHLPRARAEIREGAIATRFRQ